MIDSNSFLEGRYQLDEPIRVGVAKGGASMDAVEVGNSSVQTNLGKKGTLNEVFYTPELRRNLFSVRQMDKSGYTYYCFW